MKSRVVKLYWVVSHKFLKPQYYINAFLAVLICLVTNVTFAAEEGPTPGAISGTMCSAYPAAPTQAYIFTTGTHTLAVTGDLAATESVFGTEIYWGLSSIQKSAIHAGVIVDGQSAVISLIKSGSQSPYTGSTQNGLTSNSATSTSYGSYTISFVEDCSPSPPETPLNIDASANSMDGEYTISWEASATGNTAEGYLVLENGVSLPFPETRNYEDTFLDVSGKPNGTYLYQVFACSSGGNYFCSNAAQVLVVVDDSLGPMPNVMGTVLCSAYLNVQGNSIASMANYAAGTYLFSETGSPFGAGTVYGTDTYSGLSVLDKTIVHSGALAMGQSGIVEVTKTNVHSPSIGSTRFGITSNAHSFTSYGNYKVSFVENCLTDDLEVPENISVTPSHSVDGSYAVVWTAPSSGVNPEGYLVLENGVPLPISTPNAVRNYSDLSLTVTGKPPGYYRYEVLSCIDGENYVCSVAANIAVTVGGSLPEQGPIPGLSSTTRCWNYNQMPPHLLYLSNGTFDYWLTADSSIIYAIAGTDTYLLSNHIQKVAVHSGEVVDGESAVVRINKFNATGPYVGSTQFGITSLSSSAWQSTKAFTLTHISDCLLEPTDPLQPIQNLAVGPNPSTDGAFAITWDAPAGTDTPDGYIVFENGVSLPFPESRSYTSTALNVTGKIAGSYHYQVLACHDGLNYYCSLAEEVAVDVNLPPADTDGDGILDDVDTDDDNDGMSDVCENTYGFDPLSAADGGAVDTDGDGITNADECSIGSDPTDALSPMPTELIDFNLTSGIGTLVQGVQEIRLSNPPTNNSQFGHAIAVSGKYLAAATADGIVVVYEKQPNGFWVEDARINGGGELSVVKVSGSRLSIDNKIYQRQTDGSWAMEADLVDLQVASLSGNRAVATTPEGTPWNTSREAHVLEYDTSTAQWYMTEFTLANCCTDTINDYPPAADVYLDMAVVTDVLGSPSGTTQTTGSLQIFEKDSGGLWQEVQTIFRGDYVAYNGFGKTVQLSQFQDKIYVGAIGEIYVYEKLADDSWQFLEVISGMGADYLESLDLAYNNLAMVQMEPLPAAMNFLEFDSQNNHTTTIVSSEPNWGAKITLAMDANTAVLGLPYTFKTGTAPANVYTGSVQVVEFQAVSDWDTDGDGVIDSLDPSPQDALVANTSPDDTDGDGLPNNYELSVGLDPNDASDAVIDTDGDGATNFQEYNASSDPNDFFSCSAAECSFDPAPSATPIAMPAADTISDSVGTIAASFDVNSSGNVSYAIPLLTPAGTAGFAPNLALAYNSGAGNGLLGLGWSLTGTSSITRCPQTLTQDGVAKAIDFSVDDRFCLDGVRLVLTDSADTYGANGVEYRTEVDGGQKIISYGSQSSGPSYFRVWERDGTVSEYGKVANSQLIPAGSNNEILVWGRNRKEDTTSYNTAANNPINYTFHNDPVTSDYRLEKIEYAYGTGGIPNAVVEFNYETRTDPSEGLKLDTEYEIDTRITSIDIKNEGTLLRTYDFTFLDETAAANDNPTSKLVSIQECKGSVCLSETEFTWSDAGMNFAFDATANGVSGFGNYIQHAPSSTFTAMDFSSGITANIDGNGNRDLVWIESDSGVYKFRVATSDGNTITPTAYVSDGYTEILGWAVTDFDQDGYSDVLAVTDDGFDNTLRLFLNTEIAGVRSFNTTPVTLIADLTYAPPSAIDLPRLVKFVDINNDGLLDLSYYDRYRLLEDDVAAVHGPYKFSAAILFNEATLEINSDALYGTPAFQADIAPKNTSTGYHTPTLALSRMRHGTDFNGDGIPDMVVPIHHYNGTEPEISAQIVWQADGSGGYTVYDYFATESEDYSIVDLNRDGLPDILFGTGEIIYNTGGGFIDGNTSPGITPHMLHSLIDYNQDGYVDFVYKDNGSTALKVLYWEGDQFADPATDAITIANADYTEAFGPAGSFFDINGDGLEDYVNFNTGVYLGLDASTANNPTKGYNLVTKITNGLGNETDIEYKPLTDSSVYVRENDAVTLDWGEIVFDVMAPRYVVSRLENAAPAYDEATSAFNTAATNALSYTYAGLKTQPAGRGSLGFHMTSIVNEHTGVATENTYLQQFPFTGLLASSDTLLPSNITPVRSSTFAYSELANLNGPNTAPFRPIVTQTVSNNQAADSIASSSQVTVSGLLSTVTTDFENYDSFGNLGKSTTAVTGDGNSYTSITENTYNNDQTNWFIGQLLTTKVTTSQSGAPTVTREAAFTYAATTGLLATEIREPNQSQYKLTTTYLRDSFGNRIRATETGSGVAARYTRVEYDTDGRYIDEIYNSLEQKTLDVISRDVYGSPSITSNINGVLTYTSYGTLGRPFFEGNDSGSSSQTELRFCAAVSCPTGATYRERNFAADGSEAFVFYDNLSRPIQQQVKGFDGQLTSTDIYYDKSGRTRLSSNPYLPTSSVLWNSTEYDVLGRVIKITDAASIISTNSYARYTEGSFVGMQLTAVNAEGQVKTSVSDARGLAQEVTDDLGSRIGYEYDARGNLTKLISKGSVGTPLNIESVISYDLLGRRSSLDDPDQGIWNYEYSLFGEMTKQSDALNQSSTMSHDTLGRIVSRVDKESDNTTVEGSAAWSYISSGDGIGQLSTVADSINDFAKAFNYDDLGRVTQTYTELGIAAADGAYSEFVTYDAIGRVFQQVDATYRGMQFTYNGNGYMEKILEATNTAKEYYEVEGVDAWGNVSQAHLGNGLTEQRTFHADTGLPNRILVTNPLMQTIQDNTYTFNDVGILTNRDRFIESNSSTLSETFHYDELDRLTEASATGLPSQTFSYDITGNMLTKSDVGTYTYGAGGAGPHAVTSAGGDNYTYDAAGNMLTGGGRTVTYNTFRKPTQLVKDGHTTSFEYGPDRARYKRVDSDGTTTKTTLYVGNVEFISHSSGVAETKRYISDVAVVTESSPSGHSEHYTHKDSLGSTDVVTNSVGVVVAEMSFDAFGKRRNFLSLADLLAADYDVLNDFSTRGFTGHEMLDEVGVIHMNGRVYDPGLGRFMSADPIISDLSNVQRLNRYSYVLNSPLSYTDPSGFDCGPVSCGSMMGRVGVGVVTFSVGSNFGSDVGVGGSGSGNGSGGSPFPLDLFGNAVAGFTPGISFDQDSGVAENFTGNETNSGTETGNGTSTVDSGTGPGDEPVVEPDPREALLLDAAKRLAAISDSISPSSGDRGRGSRDDVTADPVGDVSRSAPPLQTDVGSSSLNNNVDSAPALTRAQNNRWWHRNFTGFNQGLENFGDQAVDFYVENENSIAIALTLASFTTGVGAVGSAALNAPKVYRALTLFSFGFGLGANSLPGNRTEAGAAGVFIDGSFGYAGARLISLGNPFSRFTASSFELTSVFSNAIFTEAASNER